MPNCNSQWRSGPDTHVHHQQAGAENREVQAILLMVRTGPECPEGNLREITWDSNSNRGIARERKKKKKEERERENFPTKSSKLRHCQACSQNKGLSKYQRRASRQQTGPSPAKGKGGRPVTARAKRQGANSAPETILYQTASRHPVGNQVFLGPWTVDICQGGRSQRSALQRRDTAHLKWCSCCTSRTPSSWDKGGDKTHHPPGECALTKHLVSWAAQTCEGHKTQAQQSVCLCGVPKNLNLISLDLGSARNPGPDLDSSPAEQPGAWAV